MLRFAAEHTKRQFRTELALFLCLLVTACSVDGGGPVAAVQGTSSADMPQECRADVAALQRRRVESVVDGDTLRLSSGESLRLIGVNTPEIGRDGSRDEVLAQSARRALASMAAPGHDILLGPAQDGRDRYGRLLAYAYDSQGRSLSGQLLAKGLGFHVAVSPNVQLADCLSRQELKARNAQLGVWSESAFAFKPVSRLVTGEGGFTLIRDRVSRVSFKDNGWWVQLGGKLGVKIAGPDQKFFSRKELRNLEGKWVETRGWVVPMKGGWWMMRLSHPSLLHTARDAGG